MPKDFGQTPTIILLLSYTIQIKVYDAVTLLRQITVLCWRTCYIRFFDVKSCTGLRTLRLRPADIHYNSLYLGTLLGSWHNPCVSRLYSLGNYHFSLLEWEVSRRMLQESQVLLASSAKKQVQIGFKDGGEIGAVMAVCVLVTGGSSINWNALFSFYKNV